MAIELIRP